MATDLAITGELVEPAALVLASEQAYVSEMATGLRFRDDTPIEVWGALVSRLLTQHKRIEWAIADAINFGDRCYGEVYSQWVEETGLARKTLANIAWVGRSIESSRRREECDFSYHAEVAPLPPPEQDALLGRAIDEGMTRYELREAARTRREQLRGRVADEPAPDESSAWTPQLSDLAPAVRASLEARAPTGRHRTGFIAGAIWALVWSGAEDAFLEWREP